MATENGMSLFDPTITEVFGSVEGLVDLMVPIGEDEIVLLNRKGTYLMNTKEVTCKTLFDNRTAVDITATRKLPAHYVLPHSTAMTLHSHLYMVTVGEYSADNGYCCTGDVHGNINVWTPYNTMK